MAPESAAATYTPPRLVDHREQAIAIAIAIAIITISDEPNRMS